MHDVQAVASDTGEGVPPGEPPSQGVGATVGAASSSLDSVFLSLAPEVFCSRCEVAFRPLRGAECNSLCLSCSSPSFLRSPSPKAKRHRKAEPPIYACSFLFNSVPIFLTQAACAAWVQSGTCMLSVHCPQRPSSQKRELTFHNKKWP